MYCDSPLLLCLVLDKGASVASKVKGSRYKEYLHLVESGGSFARDFLGKGWGFEDTS